MGMCMCGSKVTLHRYEGKDLDGIARLDGHNMPHAHPTTTVCLLALFVNVRLPTSFTGGRNAILNFQQVPSPWDSKIGIFSRSSWLLYACLKKGGHV